jgi:alpha-beta hydrolase superfamily lysophospholipase
MRQVQRLTVAWTSKMKNYWIQNFWAVGLSFMFVVCCPSVSAVQDTNAQVAGLKETTMPSQYIEDIQPELAGKYKFTYDGDFTKASGLPTYEWMPTGGPPKAIIVGVHGLTLHGRRYRVLARSLAVNGVGFIAMDMRGFGRCKFDPSKQFSSATDDKTKVAHEKSYQDVAKLIAAVRDKYPGQLLIVMGESLGCTYGVRLASEHKDLVDGLILSAPAVRVNPQMYIGHGNIRQGLESIVKPSHEVNLNGFINNLVSERKEVVDEMLDDPFILKSLTLLSLLATDEFVAKTTEWSKNISKHLPVLIIQGSKDRCVSAKHVIDLTNAMGSDAQTIAWRGNYGHLQLETIFMRAHILDALVDWLYSQSVDMRSRLERAEQTIVGLGGKVTN